ncbi:MAG: GAF domain-containing protein, partial [Anaerolineae bacterium]|nr:GAF domain-containing protein [Anaerolineae bacterium]
MADTDPPTHNPVNDLTDYERLMEQNRHLKSEVRRRMEHLSAVNSVASMVNQSLDLDLTLETVLAAVLDVINVEAAGISLIDLHNGDLVLRAQRGWKRDFVKMGMRMQHGVGLAWQAIEQNEIIVTGEVSHDPRIKFPAFQEEGIQAQVLVPMHSRGRVIGIL